MLVLAAAALAQRAEVDPALDLSIGPAAHLLFGPVLRDRPIHTGVVIGAELVLSKAVPDPDGWNELRFSAAFVPRTIWISPALGASDTGMYGVSFRPLGLDLPLNRGPVRVHLGVGLIVTYLYIHSRSLPSPTHFLRPGIDPTLEVELVRADPVGVNVGWTSQLYVPQRVGGGVFTFGPLDESIAHVGQLYAEVHFVLR